MRKRGKEKERGIEWEGMKKRVEDDWKGREREKNKKRERGDENGRGEENGRGRER